ncbi:prepilin peptidase [Brevibacterium sp. BRM-1]|uniref:prepilin peptidase n=1 Tax=Brevibacterium sp. BRM-1 TaxID=2999062 RepID=UPI002281FB52|nr:prepilin peptidase [Brevibacterium sp. BRM-1]WAL40911.1 prepilin peptidase [Brevibacterium sp. BRM-1]
MTTAVPLAASLALTTVPALLVSAWIWRRLPALLASEAALRLLRGLGPGQRPGGLVTFTLGAVGLVVAWLAGFIAPAALSGTWADAPILAALGLLAGATGWLCWIDSSTRRLPNRIVLPLAGACLLLFAVSLVCGALVPAPPGAGWAGAAAPAVDGLLGALLLLVFFAAVNIAGALAGRTGIGMGDVKLALPVGLAACTAGLGGLLIALIAMNLSACCQLLTARLRRGPRRGAAIAYGPHMLVGAWAAVILGPAVL